jgi:hypothetical protein
MIKLIEDGQLKIQNSDSGYCSSGLEFQQARQKARSSVSKE